MKAWTRTAKPVLAFGLAGALGAVALTAVGNLALFAGRPPEPPLLLRRGGGPLRAHTGDVQVSLTWHSTNDLDLYLVDPKGDALFHGRRHTRSGGTLDVDMNRTPPFSPEPMENIYWPDGTAPPGVYRIWVLYFARHSGGPDSNPFQVHVRARGTVSTFTGSLSERERFRYVGAFAVGDVPFDPKSVDRKGPWVDGPSKLRGKAGEAVR